MAWNSILAIAGLLPAGTRVEPAVVLPVMARMMALPATRIAGPPLSSSSTSNVSGFAGLDAEAVGRGLRIASSRVSH